MARKDNTNYYNKILSLLKELKKTYPNISFTQHLEGAMKDDTDFLILTEKSFYLSLEEYSMNLELERGDNNNSDLDLIIQDAMRIGESDYLFSGPEDED